MINSELSAMIGAGSGWNFRVFIIENSLINITKKNEFIENIIFEKSALH